MATQKKATRKRKTALPTKHVVVTSTSYGNQLKGTKIFFEGDRPGFLKKDGRMPMGKHLLQEFRRRFAKFQWIITIDTNSIGKSYGKMRIRTSRALLKRMQDESWDRSRDIKTDIVRRALSFAFPSDFGTAAPAEYVPGSIAERLRPGAISRLSAADKEALAAFLPEYIATESVGAVQMLNASAQIRSLKELASNFQAEMVRAHAESWWQDYIKANILLMQQGYIKALEKLNVAIGDTKFPDFCLVTHDNYLDILEIKKPDTPLLKHDSGRGNYYWDSEMSRAVIQTENYIEQVMSKSADVRSYLLDKQSINVKAVRPRGIILAGTTQAFTVQKQKDDFRLLSHGIKNISVVTYDELLTRLNNYIHVLETFSGPFPPAPLPTS